MRPLFDTGHVLLICSSPFADVDAIAAAMEKAHARKRITALRHMGQEGVQRLVGRWSLLGHGLIHQEVHKTWAEAVQAGAAGCVAFPGSRAEDVQTAEAAGIPVWRPYG